MSKKARLAQQKQAVSDEQKRLDAAVKQIQVILDQHKLAIVCNELHLIDGKVFPQVRLQSIQPVPTQPQLVK